MAHRRLAAAGTLGVLLAGLVWDPDGALSAQQPPPHAFITVFDQSGAPVSDLQPSQVTMTVDGAPCTPVTLEPIDWPMRLTILVDNGSESADVLPTLRDGLRRFLFEVPDGVEMSLLTLAPQPRWIVRPTAERQDIWKGIDLLTTWGSAKLVEGLAEAAARIDKDKSESFFVILVVTTNGPESSGGDLQRTVNRLRAQIAARPVTVHAVMLAISGQRTADMAAGSSADESASRPAFVLKATGALQTQVNSALTRETGGRYEAVAAATSLLTILPEYGRQIARSQFLQSHQYRVSCASTARNPQIAVFTSYPRAFSMAVTRDGRLP
jgi:hypothetical protein